jgi:hypothetical protein
MIIAGQSVSPINSSTKGNETNPMIRAIIKDGAIQPLDPLPADWRDGRDGREVIVEEAEPLSTDDLEEWYRELQLLGPAQYEPGEWDQVQAALSHADEQAKSHVRREMGLD